MANDQKKQIIGIYAISFVLLLLLHLKMGYVSDDAWYISFLENNSKFDGILNAFSNSPGRFLTDTLGTILNYCPMSLWKVLDSLCYLAIIKMIEYLFFKKSDVRSTGIVALCIFLFPFSYLSSAGYIHTSSNYVYPIACILLALVPIRIAMKNAKVSKLWVVLGCLACVYASNQEQSALLLIMMLLYLVIASLTKKRIKASDSEVASQSNNDREVINTTGRIAIIELIISIIGFLTVIINPNHIIRAKETTGDFAAPGYSEWTAFDKLYHGYSSTVANLFFQPIVVYIVFCFLLCIISIRNKKTIIKIIGSVPLIITIVMAASGYSHFIVFNDYAYGMPEIWDSSVGLKHVVVPIVISVTILLCILISVYKAFDNKRISLGIVYIYLISFGTRVMIGFSSSIYGSSFRTFIYLLFYFLVMNMIFAEKIIIRIKNKFWITMLIFVVMIFAVYNYLYFLLEI